MYNEKINSKLNKFSLDLVAHRGNVGGNISPLNQVDNSMEAIQVLIDIITFNPEIEDAIKGFECDVRLTKDKELIVTHEGNIKTITPDKIDRNIKSLTYKELHKIFVTDINYYYKVLRLRACLFPDVKKLWSIISQKLEKQAIIPKASDMFDYLSTVRYKGEILVELKELTDECKEATIELINAYKNKLNIAVQSYDVDRVIDIKEKTGIKSGILEDVFRLNQKNIIDKNFIKNMPFEFYSLIWPKVTAKKLDSIIDNDKELYTWTIDSASHLLIILNALEDYYKRTGILPKNSSLITNITLLLNEYLSGNSDNNNLKIKKILEKYNYLYGQNNFH